MEQTAISMHCRKFEFYVCGVIIGTLCFLGLLGNGTSIIVLWKHKTETATVLLLQCLAFADSLLLATSLFVYTLPVVNTTSEAFDTFHDDNEYIKKFVWPLGMIAHTSAVWLTVLVTLHRFFFICKPLGLYIKFNNKFIRILVLVVFSISILYNLPRFFEHHIINSPPPPSSSSPPSTRNTSTTDNGSASSASAAPQRILGDSMFYQILYSNVLYFPVMYIIPLISLMYLNFKLIVAVRRLKTRKAELTGHRAPEDHITLCIIFIVITFVICQTPALINQILWAVTDHEDRECGQFHFYYTRLSDVLVVINSSVNFIIYCLFGKSFREIFIEFFCANSIVQYIKSRNNCSHMLVTQETTAVPLQDI